VRDGWPLVKVGVLGSGESAEYRVGDPVRVRAGIALGSLLPADVRVEVCIGSLDADGRITEPRILTMAPTAFDGESRYTYEAEAATSSSSGRHGYTVRVRPDHPDLDAAFIPSLITWSDSEI
jgi:glycogen phosphorylase